MTWQVGLPGLIADSAIETQLEQKGGALLPKFASFQQCEELRTMYAHEAHFRSRVIMSNHGFGRGEYQYFRYPLPPQVQLLRTALYGQVVQVANRWNIAMGIDVHYSHTLDEFIQHCHKAGQQRPTPLMIQYGPGDFNCLHQDLYGENVFPLQVAILLSDPATDFDGGEFVLTEQRPRMQSRVQVVPLRQGDGVIFPVRYRPVRGGRGVYRVNLRHGVSEVRSGARYTLGLIFHDAR